MSSTAATPAPRHGARARSSVSASCEARADQGKSIISSTGIRNGDAVSLPAAQQIRDAARVTPAAWAMSSSISSPHSSSDQPTSDGLTSLSKSSRQPRVSGRTRA